jgi:predicted porin
LAFILSGETMKKSLSVALAIASIVGVQMANAEISLYGKANVTLESVDKGAVRTTELVSNASRLGFKGGEKLNNGMEAIYQLEYELTIDNDKSFNDQTFKQRNIFIGVKGGYGQVIAGFFDTPLKAAQNKIDLFNDLRGDMKNVVTPHEKRVRNAVQYSTPNTLNGFKVDLAVASSEVDGVDEGKSAAVSWANSAVYVAAAIDQDVAAEGVDATRLVIQYTISQWQLGGMYETTDASTLEDSFTGYLLSAQYKLHKHWLLKAQYGTSDGYLDQKFENGVASSIGADYLLSENTKLFAFYTKDTADNDLLDRKFLGLGMEMKF